MKRNLAALLGAFIGGILGGILCDVFLPVRAQEKAIVAPPVVALSEVQQLKAQILGLKVQNAQLSVTLADRESRLASISLSKEQADLAAEFLKSVKAPEGSTWDWATMVPKPPEKTPAKPADKATVPAPAEKK